MDGGDPASFNCSKDSLHLFELAFERSIDRTIWRVDTLLFTQLVLAGIIVGIGVCGQRYRQHPFTRFILLGATILFLPILSSVVSTLSNSTTPARVKQSVTHSVTAQGPEDGDALCALVAACQAKGPSNRLVVWALLVQIVMVSTSTVAATEGRERRSRGPPMDLIIQGVWTIYLGFTFESRDLAVDNDYFRFPLELIAPFCLLCAKIVLKYYAFEKARRSFALGRNPGLTFVYMERLQIQEANQQQSEPPVGSSDQCPPPPPPLLVMREDENRVEIQPRGYAFKDDSGTVLTKDIGFVTLDRVWLSDSIGVPPISTPQLKGLCLSFALFKLLRCRFPRYKLSNAGSTGTLIFFRSLSLQPGEHERIFRVIADELSFVHDYYYSSLPISYAKSCLPILNIFLSLLSIGYCITLAAIFIQAFSEVIPYVFFVAQIRCDMWWIQGHSVHFQDARLFGTVLVDLVALLLVVILVMIVEVRDIVSYICSNWTKVTLICRYVTHTSSQQSLRIQKLVISLLLRCRCKLIMKQQHWDEKMSQCSILALHQRTALPAFVRLLLLLPDQKWKVKVTAAVKVCMINTLRSSIINGSLSNGVASLSRSQVGESLLWACDGGKGTSGTILVWHIATSIAQVRGHRSDKTSDSDHKIVATQLSQYCAYLVSWCPELLPDNNAWSTSLYKAVKKDAEGALAGYSSSTPEAEDERALGEYPVAEAESSTGEDDGYQKLVRLLSENSKHEVLRDGVKLGTQLVETMEDPETMWELLAEFWSEMILYLAPSDNLKGHSEAIARGGELITLLWALLFHAGFVSRPGEDDGDTAATTSAGVV